MVLQPRAGRAKLVAALVQRLQLRRLAFAERREVVADEEGQHAEDQPEAGKQRQRARRAETTGAQDRVLRRLRHPRKRVDRADQHRDRCDLVEVPRHQQQRVQRRMQHRVVALTDVAQLVDEIDEERQRQEGRGDERHRRDDVGVEQPANRPHAFTIGRRQPIRLVPCSRHHSRPMAIRNAPPCATTSALPMLALPPAIQASVRLMTL